VEIAGEGPRRITAWEKAILGVRIGEVPRLLPGLALALGLALLAQAIAGRLGAALLAAQGLDPAGRGSPISAIPVAVLLGMAIANLAGLHRAFAPGVDFAVKKVLRLGIVLVGIQLSAVDVLRIGAVGVPIVAALVAFALFASIGVARAAGASGALGALAAASTAICGITATLAVAPGVDADEREVACTVANVTVFGLFGMLVYPWVAHGIFGDASAAAGLFLGTAIHDTSQVMGAALSYRELFGDPRAMEVATITKLTRNAMLVAVVPLLAWLHARRAGGAGRRTGLAHLFPVFVLGFLALSLLRTAGDLGLAGGGLALGAFDAAAWRGLTARLGGELAILALGTALAGVGLGTRLSVFRGLGPRPFLVGLAAALLVGGAALGLAALCGPLLG